MKYYILLIVSQLISSAHAEEFTIREKKYYGGESLELQRVDTGGATISRIFELTEPNDDELRIRILSPISGAVGSELLTFYNEYYPNELKEALNSSGNLHNPALKGLVKHFKKAFKSTTLFKELNKALNLNGYKVVKIHFEKFTIYSGKIYVAEITLYSEKGT